MGLHHRFTPPPKELYPSSPVAAFGPKRARWQTQTCPSNRRECASDETISSPQKPHSPRLLPASFFPNWHGMSINYPRQEKEILPPAEDTISSTREKKPHSEFFRRLTFPQQNFPPLALNKQKSPFPPPPPQMKFNSGRRRS